MSMKRKPAPPSPTMMGSRRKFFEGQIYDVMSDGNCFYRAVINQLHKGALRDLIEQFKKIYIKTKSFELSIYIIHFKVIKIQLRNLVKYF